MQTGEMPCRKIEARMPDKPVCDMKHSILAGTVCIPAERPAGISRRADSKTAEHFVEDSRFTSSVPVQRRINLPS
jgi:hypothetical protein